MVIDGYTVLMSNWIKLTLASVKNTVLKNSLEMVNSKSATIRLKFDIQKGYQVSTFVG